MIRKRRKEVLKNYATRLLDAYKYKLRDSNTIASGNLESANSKVMIEESHDSVFYNIVFNIEEYWKYVEDGRKPGTFPPKDALMRWIDDKGIVPQPFQLPSGRTVLPSHSQLAYLIGRKIFNDGIESKPFISQSLKEVEVEFLNALRDAIAEDTKEELVKILNN